MYVNLIEYLYLVSIHHTYSIYYLYIVYGHTTKDGLNYQNQNILSGLVEIPHSFYLFDEINSSVYRIINHSKVLLSQN